MAPKGSVPPPATPRGPPPKASFATFLWNRQTGEVLGRTGASWGKIGLFYVVFYLFLAGFFSLTMAVFYSTLDYDMPKYIGTESILTNPGLGYRPGGMEQSDRKYHLTYDPKDTEATDKLVDSIDTLLKPYNNLTSDVKYHTCPLKKGEEGVCLHQLGGATTCTKEGRWGYGGSEPCLFLKLNKIIGFIPKPVSDVSTLPASLLKHLNATRTSQDGVFIWCETEAEGVWLEQPYPSLPSFYYPYNNQPGYLSPLSPVRLRNVTVGVPTTVMCKVWAENIVFKVDNRATGMATFVITVENKKKKKEL